MLEYGRWASAFQKTLASSRTLTHTEVSNYNTHSQPRRSQYGVTHCTPAKQQSHVEKWKTVQKML
jgi:hypothetical protein